MGELFTVAALVSFVTLTVLEIVLGIDNVIFISILAGKLPDAYRDKVRSIGLALALILRVILLFFITEIAKLTFPVFTIMDHGFSWRDLIMIGGGLFLLAKSTSEIHNKLEGDEHGGGQAKQSSFWGAIVQIAILDVVFSIDSVITAVGLAQHLEIMIAAVVIAVGVMFFTAKTVSQFIEKHPTLKMLALAFLLMVGLVLFAEGFGAHIDKSLIYSAMAFSTLVEFLNMKLRSKKSSKPIKLHNSTLQE